MKKLLAAALGVVMLAALPSPGAAQQKAEEKKLPTIPLPRRYAPGDTHFGSTPKKEVPGIESEIPVKGRPSTGIETKQPATGERKDGSRQASC